jgi:hypothetical protein
MSNYAEILLREIIQFGYSVSIKRDKLHLHYPKKNRAQLLCNLKLAFRLIDDAKQYKQDIMQIMQDPKYSDGKKTLKES